MNKKALVYFCLTIIISFAIVQIALSCNCNFNSEKVVYLEEELASQQKIKQQLLSQLAQKNKLSNVDDFAQKNGFIGKPQTLVLSEQSSYAYNW